MVDWLKTILEGLGPESMVLVMSMLPVIVDCTGFAGHVEKTYNEVKGRVRNYEREQISQKV